MIHTKIPYNEAVYYNLHAEQCLNMLNEDNGVETISVRKTTLDEICEDIESDSKHTVFVLECQNVENTQINAFEKRVGEIVNRNGKIVVLANANENLLKTMTMYSFFEDCNQRFKEGAVYKWFTLKKDYDCFQLATPKEAFGQCFMLKIKKFLKRLPKNNDFHPSSSVRLTSYIDIKRFIVEEKPFMLFSIYTLALKIKLHWKDIIDSSQKRPILVCQSLNGSYVASVVAMLLDLDLYILDQVGPINKLYRALGAKIKADANYLVVSDMVCLGTEVKIVKNIIEYLGGNYIGNVTIVRTTSVKEYDNTEEVFKININNCKELNYKIITAI